MAGLPWGDRPLPGTLAAGFRYAALLNPRASAEEPLQEVGELGEGVFDRCRDGTEDAARCGLHLALTRGGLAVGVALRAGRDGDAQVAAGIRRHDPVALTRRALDGIPVAVPLVAELDTGHAPATLVDADRLADPHSTRDAGLLERLDGLLGGVIRELDRHRDARAGLR